MSVKQVTFIYLAIIAILIVVVAAGRAILPAEYFYKGGLLAARYTYAIWLLKLLLYITPLYMVMMYILKVGENITLGKATIILIVSGAIIFVAFPTVLSFLKPEHLAYLGIKPAYLEGIGYSLGIAIGVSLGLVPFFIFLNALMRAGNHKITPNDQGIIELHIKAGPRLLFIATPVVLGLLLAYGPLSILKDKNPIISMGIILPIALFLVWGSIDSAVLRMRYDVEYIYVKTLLFGERKFRWADLLKIKAPGYSSRKHLVFNTGIVRVDDSLEGHNDLLKFAQEKINDA